jgi:hypothetical protein
MDAFDKKDEKLAFYRSSGYYKEKNQKIAGVIYLYFIIFIDQSKRVYQNIQRIFR